MTLTNQSPPRKTRTVKIGSIVIGGDHPVALQSMAASPTSDIDATVETVNRLAAAGAEIVRIAVDHDKDAAALAEIRKRTSANLSVDLQENYRLAEKAAPSVDKIRYNPGHLHHGETDVSWRDKVRYLAKVADDHDVALRIGVNCGSLDPVRLAEYKAKLRRSRTDPLTEGQAALPSAGMSAGASPQPPGGGETGIDPFAPILESALEHADFLDSIGFTRFCVSLKDSDPETVILVNRRFARLRPEIPLHLGVTEAGLPPFGILKSRFALETLLAEGIGETLRVSLTVENGQKGEEIKAGRLILANAAAGTILKPEDYALPKLNIVSCPSCARVQNGAFVALAEKVREATAFAGDYPIKIAVMGCRVNGPGETDDADLGLWCGVNRVNLKEGERLVGSWPYSEIVGVLVERLKEIVAAKRA